MTEDTTLATFYDGPWDTQTRVVLKSFTEVITPFESKGFAKYILIAELDSLGFRVFQFAGWGKTIALANSIKSVRKVRNSKP